jgi:hypothetical protein
LTKIAAGESAKSLGKQLFYKKMALVFPAPHKAVLGEQKGV